MHRSFERLQSISRPVLSLVVSLERRGGGRGGAQADTGQRRVLTLWRFYKIPGSSDVGRWSEGQQTI